MWWTCIPECLVEEIVKASLACRVLQVSEVECVALDQDDPQHVAPLAIRHRAAPSVPVELAQHLVLGRRHPHPGCRSRQRNEHTTFDLATIQQPVAEDEEVELVEDRDDPYDEREGAAGAAGAAHETGGVSRAASASARPKRRR